MRAPERDLRMIHRFCAQRAWRCQINVCYDQTIGRVYNLLLMRRMDGRVLRSYESRTVQGAIRNTIRSAARTGWMDK